MRYKIHNEMIECEIDSHGAELKSLVRRSDGKQIMWGADPAYWNRTSPVLFPFVGGVKDKNRYRKGSTPKLVTAEPKNMGVSSPARTFSRSKASPASSSSSISSCRRSR